MAGKIMVIAAHPDDEVLGVGGTIRKHVDKGDTVNCLILGQGMASRVDGNTTKLKKSLKQLKDYATDSACVIGINKLFFSDLPDNKFDSCDLIDVIRIVEKFIKAETPETIYTHHYSDLNVDHRVTFEAVSTACRPVAGCSVKEILCFETASSTEWNLNSSIVFRPNVFVDIEKTIEKKLDAMACYKSEIRQYPHPRSLEALRIIAARWGLYSGLKYAEAFELTRKLI
jgi:N-acetylglucosamine malate deacetylase 1